MILRLTAAQKDVLASCVAFVLAGEIDGGPLEVIDDAAYLITGSMRNRK